MKRIEIFGVEGIGKTTLYSELKKRRNNTDSWKTMEEARSKLAYYHLIEGQRLTKTLFVSYLIKINLNMWLTSHLCDYALEDLEKHTLIDENKLYDPFLKVLLDYCCMEGYTPQIRLERIIALYRIILKTAHLDNYDSPDIYLSEANNFSLFGLLLPHWYNKDYKRFVRSYFENMPPPFGLIYCTLDLEETISRIVQRKKCGIITTAHRNPLNFDSILDDDQLINVVKSQIYCVNIGVEILKERGVKILEVQMSEELTNNINQISIFLKSLYN